MTLDAARDACDENRWVDACAAFSTLDVGGLEIDDIDRFATAAYLTGNDELGFDLWRGAHVRCLEQGNVHQAALFGTRLAQSLGFKGDMPRAQGWVDRTARCLAAADIDCVEQGHLRQVLGLGRVFEAGDLVGALEHFEQAEKIAERYGDRGLATVARIAIARMRIYLGDLAAGLSLLDEAMVSIEGGELSVLATGDAYCTVIDACAELSDVARLRAWTASMVRWCEQHQGLVIYRGHCFIHRTEVLTIEGRWVEALDEARAACDHLAQPLPAALGAAKRLEGDVLRLLERLDEAEQTYRQAGDLGHEPQPGLALLRLAQGQIAAASAMIRRVLTESVELSARSRVLPSYVEIMLDCGALAEAHNGAVALRELTDQLPSPFLRAESTLATGAVQLTNGDPFIALPNLRRAFSSFIELGAGPRAARARNLIATACDALDDADTATIERGRAESALSSYRSPSETTTTHTAPPDDLTIRELEVLRAVAQGKTNRAIGRELFIAEKTVASHLSHIFTKINVSSRAAATAYAYDNGLV